MIELTEHAKVESYGRLYGGLDACRSAGAAIAIDDAGARYAGLTHLLRVRPDFVKVDSTLVAGIDRDDVKRAFVEAVGTLASRLDAWVVAEGIERVEDLDR